MHAVQRLIRAAIAHAMSLQVRARHAKTAGEAEAHRNEAMRWSDMAEAAESEVSSAVYPTKGEAA